MWSLVSRVDVTTCSSLRVSRHIFRHVVSWVVSSPLVSRRVSCLTSCHVSRGVISCHAMFRVAPHASLLVSNHPSCQNMSHESCTSRHLVSCRCHRRRRCRRHHLRVTSCPTRSLFRVVSSHLMPCPAQGPFSSCQDICPVVRLRSMSFHVMSCLASCCLFLCHVVSSRVKSCFVVSLSRCRFCPVMSRELFSPCVMSVTSSHLILRVLSNLIYVVRRAASPCVMVICEITSGVLSLPPSVPPSLSHSSELARCLCGITRLAKWLLVVTLVTGQQLPRSHSLGRFSHSGPPMYPDASSKHPRRANGEHIYII